MIERIGKYRILERIGRGGMGTVFKAHDPTLDRLVALKVISGETEVTPEVRSRFYRKAKACARLSHPNIITVHELGEDEGRLIVMELLEGEEVKAIIAERRERRARRQARPDDPDLRPAQLCPSAGDHPPRREARQHLRPAGWAGNETPFVVKLRRTESGWVIADVR